MNTSRRRRRPQGFTLVEIMVVVIVLAILAATIIPQFASTTYDAKVSRARLDISNLENALERFFVTMDRYPTTQEGLRALLAPPQDGQKNWRGPYIKELIPDPWDNPYLYRTPGLRGSRTYDLWSRGLDGKDGGEDRNADITNWHEEGAEG